MLAHFDGVPDQDGEELASITLTADVSDHLSWDELTGSTQAELSEFAGSAARFENATLEVCIEGNGTLLWSLRHEEARQLAFDGTCRLILRIPESKSEQIQELRLVGPLQVQWAVD